MLSNHTAICPRRTDLIVNTVLSYPQCERSGLLYAIRVAAVRDGMKAALKSSRSPERAKGKHTSDSARNAADGEHSARSTFWRGLLASAWNSEWEADRPDPPVVVCIKLAGGDLYSAPKHEM